MLVRRISAVVPGLLLVAVVGVARHAHGQIQSGVAPASRPVLGGTIASWERWFGRPSYILNDNRPGLHDTYWSWNTCTVSTGRLVALLGRGRILNISFSGGRVEDILFPSCTSARAVARATDDGAARMYFPPQTHLLRARHNIGGQFVRVYASDALKHEIAPGHHVDVFGYVVSRDSFSLIETPYCVIVPSCDTRTQGDRYIDGWIVVLGDQGDSV
jgi:hypothetical protein